MTNLFDGVDLYSLTDQSRLSSISVEVKENVSADVTFASNDSIVFGGGSGLAYIAEGIPPTVRHTLKHGGGWFLPFVDPCLICDRSEGDVVQALASLSAFLLRLFLRPELRHVMRLVGVSGL